MLARIYLTVTVIIWGWTFVATRLCLAHLSPELLLTARFVIALPVLVLILFVRKTPLRTTRRDAPWILLGSALFVAHFLIQNWGLVFTSATHTSWLVSVSPLAMAVLAFLLLRERIGPRTVAGIGVAGCGVVLLVSNGRLNDFGWLHSVGDWLALTSAFTWALYTIATRNLSRNYPPMLLLVLMLIPATIGMVVYTAATADWSTLMHLPARPLVALLYLAVGGMAVANWLWLEGVSRVGAARAGVFLYLEPLSTTALAVPYLGEKFGLMAAGGALLVLAGVALAARNGNQGIAGKQVSAD
jgi:drug/metabolite transporter (DMT)-like permease